METLLWFCFIAGYLCGVKSLFFSPKKQYEDEPIIKIEI